MKKILMVLAATTALTASAAWAQDAKKGEAAAKESGCLTCHDVAKKKIGPAFKDAAAGLKKAGPNVDKAVAAIKGKHADTKASDDDLKNIAAWLLAM